MLESVVVVPVDCTGASVRFEAIGATAGSSSWLVVSQSSPFTPAYINVGVAPQVSPPAYTRGTVSVVSTETINSPQTITVTLHVTDQPGLTASPFGMIFSYEISGPAALQMAVISNQGAPMSFSLSAETQSGGNWLLAAGGGTTPATIAAAIDPKNLAPGTYTGNLLVTPTSGTADVLQVPVILNVDPGPVFRTDVNQVLFQYQTGGPVPLSQTFNVSATGNSSLSFSTQVVAGDGGAWLKVSPNVTTTPGGVAVVVAPEGLAPGLYSGLIILTAANGATPTSYVPVSLQVSNGPILTVPGQQLTFNAKVGGGPTAPQTIILKGTGVASQFDATPVGGSWLEVGPTTGTTDAALNVVASPGDLPAEYYFGVVNISIPGVANSQQHVPVAFVISAQ